jgi:hypothetical protein
MQSIQSMICFVGGSGGDFLKSVCLQQVNPDYKFDIDQNGMVINQNYFKNFCKSIYHGQENFSDIDWNRVSIIENSHHVLPWFFDMIPQVFFIDYPDTAHSEILSIFVQKRLKGQIHTLKDLLKQSLSTNLHKFLKDDNLLKSGEILWRKQISIWRNTQGLEPIHICQIIDKESLIQLVCKILSKTEINENLLYETHQQWVENNPRLIGYFKKLCN